MLGLMRDRRGRPNSRVRLLAFVLVLPLGGPLTVLAVRFAVELAHHTL